MKDGDVWKGFPDLVKAFQSPVFWYSYHPTMRGLWEAQKQKMDIDFFLVIVGNLEGTVGLQG